MSNTNRDYAIVYDIKNSSLILSRPLVFYTTDKNTSNIFIRLVTKTNIGNGVDQYTDIENASNYILIMRVIKPNDEVTSTRATQREPGSIFEFDLTENFKDIPGTYICELMISTMVNSRQELITSDLFTYEVKRSILSRIDQIIEHEDTTVEKLLNELDATKAELSSQVEGLETRKADQSFVDAQFATIVSGAPKGTFQTLSSLKAAYPSGTSGIFLVLADGHWYYWNNDASDWLDGGVYQSTGISKNSITMDKFKCSQGSLQDCIYVNNIYYITRVNSDLKIKFIGSPILYYKNIELKTSLTMPTTEFIIPHNYSLVYSFVDNAMSVINTDNVTNTDLILVSCHNGIDKVNNLKNYNPTNYPIVHSDATFNYVVNGDGVITINISGDKRVFIKSNTFGHLNYNFAIDLNSSYTLNANEALCASLYSNSIVIKNWDNLALDDVVLCVNRKSKLIHNILNIEEKGQFLYKNNNVAYYRGKVYLEANEDGSFDVHFENVTNKQIFYKLYKTQGYITIDTLKYTINHNQSLGIDIANNKLIVGDTDILSNTSLILLTVHNATVKYNIMKIENLNTEGYSENQCENVATAGNMPTGQGMTKINNKLLLFEGSKDDHSDYAKLNLLDINNLSVLKTINHNLGHVNSIDYNAKNDCLIIGNNTGFGQEIPPAIYIIYNASTLIEQDTIDFNTIEKTIINLYDGDNYLGGYGDLSRPNVCWGENDNIAYLLMNDNGVCYKLFLGKETNNLNATKTELTWGIYEEATTEKYNGTCKILGTYYNSNQFGVNQGIAYYKGNIYTSSSHSDLLVSVYSLNSKGYMKLEKTYNNNILDRQGTKIVCEPEDICINEGKLIQSFRGGMNGLSITQL